MLYLLSIHSKYSWNYTNRLKCQEWKQKSKVNTKEYNLVKSRDLSLFSAYQLLCVEQYILGIITTPSLYKLEQSREPALFSPHWNPQI